MRFIGIFLLLVELDSVHCGKDQMLQVLEQFIGTSSAWHGSIQAHSSWDVKLFKFLLESALIYSSHSSRTTPFNKMGPSVKSLTQKNNRLGLLKRTDYLTCTQDMDAYLTPITTPLSNIILEECGQETNKTTHCRNGTLPAPPMQNWGEQSLLTAFAPSLKIVVFNVILVWSLLGSLNQLCVSSLYSDWC